MPLYQLNMLYGDRPFMHRMLHNVAESNIHVGWRRMVCDSLLSEAESLTSPLVPELVEVYK